VVLGDREQLRLSRNIGLRLQYLIDFLERVGTSSSGRVMRTQHEQAIVSLGPDEISALSALHEDAVALLTNKDGPYSRVDHDKLSLVVARTLISASRHCIDRLDVVEQMILRDAARTFGNLMSMHRSSLRIGSLRTL
jgi:hypothetical protein